MTFNASEEVEKCKRLFNNHLITKIADQNGVYRFSYRRPDSGTYGFALTCADNLIIMNGDCYSLLVEPGYGRNGLAFLLSNVTRDPFYYFLSKVPHCVKDSIKEYSKEKAEQNLREYVKEEYITEEDLEDWEDEFEGKYGEMKYYEFCHEKQIEEPSSPNILDGQTILQIAGLQCFVEQYKIDNPTLFNED